MRVLQYIIFILLAAIGALAAVVFRWNYLGRKKMKYGNIIQKQQKPLLVFGITYIVIAVLSVFIFNRKQLYLTQTTEYIIFWCAVFLCAVIDFKVKKIPNAVILLLFIVRCVGMLFEYIEQGYFSKDILVFSVVGLLIGG